VASVNINLKRVEIILEQISTIINYLKFEWTTGYIIEKIYYILISVLQNDGIALTIFDQNKETIKDEIIWL
jgi:hypothetical protein